jgi:hypothetical protein
MPKSSGEDKATQIVRGTVRTPDGAPLAGIKVWAYDADLPSLGPGTPLGQPAFTDAQGFYQIAYQPAEGSAGELGNVDLRIRAFDATSTELAASPILFNTPAEAVIDLVVEAEGKDSSEYERVQQAVDTLRQEKIAVTDLTAADIAFAADESGFAAELIALFVLAHRHAAPTQITPAVFYGLMREGLPTELQALLAQGTDVHRDVLKRAVAENVVPAYVLEQLDWILGELKALRARVALREPGSEQATPLGVILGTALPSTELQEAFLTRYNDHQGAIEAFWQQLRAQPEFKDNSLVDQLQFTLQLSALTGGNAPLVQLLRQGKGIASPRDLTSLDVQGWQERITAADPQGEQIPATIKGDTVEEKVANYAGSIVETLRAAFPMNYVARGIAEQPQIDLPLVKQVLALNESFDPRYSASEKLNWGDLSEQEQKRARDSLAALRAELTMFPGLRLDEVRAADSFVNVVRADVQQVLVGDSDFDLGAVQIDEYLAGPGKAAMPDDARRATVADQLKRMQRVYQITPRYEQMAALLANGFESAAGPASMPEALFVAQIGGEVGAEQARLMHENATQIAAESVAILGAAAAAEHDVAVRAVAPNAVPERVRATYGALFGRLNLCACEECRSVASPAAYLVDLLHFLDRKPLEWDTFVTKWERAHSAPYPFAGAEEWETFRTDWERRNLGVLPLTGRTPFEVLMERRPDLQHILLTCENTHTPIPYIDLVNEVLEAYVANNARLPDRSLGDAGRATSAELLASPQHSEASAYNTLKGEIYPITLPFDRDLVTVRVYLEHLGTSRYAVLRAFQKTRPLNGDAQTDLSLEYLRLSPGDVAALINSSGRWLGAFYGYGDSPPDTPVPVKLASVGEFLARTGISYDDLDAILKTRFINPQGPNAHKAVTILDPEGSCDPARRRLQRRPGKPLFDAQWDQLQRFIRLWRRLGWPIHDLDRALTALNVVEAAHINERTLRRLGQVAQLRDELGLSLAETLSLWAPIDTHGDEGDAERRGSLYARLFLGRTVRELAAIPTAFELDDAGEVRHIGQTITDNRAVILAALRIRAVDLDTLLAGLPGMTDVVTLATLSTLHRHAVLARALHLTVRDLLTLRELSGLDPFPASEAPDTGGPTSQEATARFVELARKLQRSGCSVALLDYLYRHRDDPAGSFAHRAARWNAALRQLRAELLEQRESFAEPDDERRLRALLTAAVPDAALIAAIVERSYRSAAISDTHRRDALSQLGRFLSAAAATDLLDGAEALRGARRAELARRILDDLGADRVAHSVGEALGVDETIAMALLRSPLPSSGAGGQTLLNDFLALRDLADATSAPDLVALLHEPIARLHEAALLIKSLDPTLAEVTYLTGNPAIRATGLIDLPVIERAPALPRLTAWERLADLVAFRKTLPADADFVTVLRATNPVEPRTATPAELRAAGLATTKRALLAATDWDSAALDSALGPGGFNVTDPAWLRDGTNLLALAAAVDLAQRIGVAPDVGFAWAGAVPDVAQARAVQGAVKARYDEQQWLAVAKTLNDPLRQRRRDALVAYVLTMPRILAMNIRTPDELFEHFLIDVEMGACMATSRIKQAISSVQLFVQRCLMNLEPGVAPAALRADWWQWMHSYRIWEANRKVFLHPENWIEPELRDDKSPFFKDLENDLLQNDVTDDTAEAALLRYLEQLDEVARLDIRGLYWEHESERTWDQVRPSDAPVDIVHPANCDHQPEDRADVLHIFGRTRGTPPIYYYRRLVDHSKWTPWEKVQADIEGDHLVPVIFNRRLYLFWPIFREVSDPDQAPPARDAQPRRPEKRLEIKLAWSEYKNGVWSAKRVSEAYLTGTPRVRNDALWSLSTCEEGKSLQIICKEDAPQGLSVVFVFDAQRDPAPQSVPHVHDRLPEAMPFFVRRAQRFALMSRIGLFFANDGEVQWVFPEPRTPQDLQRWNFGESIVTAPRQGLAHLFHAPFTWQRHDSIFLVTPEQEADIAQQLRQRERVVLHLPSPLAVLAAAANRDSSKPLPGAVQWIDRTACPGDRSGDHSNPTDSSPTSLKLRFHTFYHPYVCDFVKVLKRRGVPGLLSLCNQRLSAGDEPFQAYNPRPFVDPRYPHEEVDFEDGAYASYNWELFFHAPLLIATCLSANQRFAEAQRWFHFIFDPTSSSSEPSPQRFWKTLPFNRNQQAPQEQIAELLDLLSYRGDDPQLLERKQKVEEAIREWRDDPFNPHKIARTRITAYQKTVVMKYIDNLIAWGDQLFRQDTIETINQATQLYVLAALMLGKRPETVPPSDTAPPQSYRQLRPQLDAFSNALVATENAVSRRRCVGLTPRRNKGVMSRASLGVAYFCVPQNDKLLGYWDTVADRLFKLRHCMNIEGVVRQLPLFEPPIDPALLVRARAAGLDLGRELAGGSAPRPHYRFAYVLQKALELCSELRGLGAALLAAHEKRDAEELALLRSTHEIRLLEQVKLVRQKQAEEAEEAIKGLEKSKAVVETRWNYYRDIKQISAGERLHQENLNAARGWQVVAQSVKIASTLAHLFPNVTVGISGVASSPVATVIYGGSFVGTSLQAASEGFEIVAGQFSHEATMASINAGYERRWEEWKHQENVANKEIEQIDQQIVAAQIRLAIAEQELRNHDLQIEQSRTVDVFMRSRKFTRKELYDWMFVEIAKVYFAAYQLAYEMAKRAERAFQFERGLASSSIVRFDAWDSLRGGLLAGERMALDLKRLEAAYLEQNRREYEITKHVSLVLHNPLALIALKATGECEVDLPELLFDADYPGHYMRRIKSVGLTIPAVVGPYTSVNCTLTLLSDRTRIDAVSSSDDSHYTPNFVSQQSIATSHAQNDSGMFELNFRDDRYLPFEGAGAISRWRIALPPDTNAFDLNTITDVVLRISYTARDGGDGLRDAARSAFSPTSTDGPPRTFQRLFSLKHEFAVEWFQFLGSTPLQPMRFALTPERFPFQFRGRRIAVQQFDLFIVPRAGAGTIGGQVTLTPPGGAEARGGLAPYATPSPLLHASVRRPDAGILWSTPIGAPGLPPNYTWSLDLASRELEDIWLVCTFTSTTGG